jgi:antitoxin YefM
MERITLSVFKRKLPEVLDRVNHSGKPVLISCGDKNEVVLMSKSEYNSMQETFHLLKTPKNAARLLRSIEADKGNSGGVSNKPLL